MHVDWSVAPCDFSAGENASVAAKFPTSVVRERLEHPPALFSTCCFPPPPLHPLRRHRDQLQQPPPDYDSRRRSRTNFTGFQLDTLERAFSRRHYPDSGEVAELAYQLSISESRVQVTAESLFSTTPRPTCAPQLSGWPTVAKRQI